MFSFLSLTLNSPDSADHMGSYGPAFYQSYGASGQFAYEFDGEQLFSVELKKKEAVWRLPEFGNLAHFDPQNGLASIAVIKAHLDVLVERSNRTRATNGIGLSSPRTLPFPVLGRGGPKKLLPTHRPPSTLACPSFSLCDCCIQLLSFPGGSRTSQTLSAPSSSSSLLRTDTFTWTPPQGPVRHRSPWCPHDPPQPLFPLPPTATLAVMYQSIPCLQMPK